MKKILIVTAILVLTAGVSHAGDSFDILISPFGFGFHVGGSGGQWLPAPPLPPPGPPPGYYARWFPPPFWWGRPDWRHRHGYRPRYRSLPPRHYNGPPRHVPRPGYPGGRHGGFRHR